MKTKEYEYHSDSGDILVFPKPDINTPNVTKANTPET